VWSLVAIPGMPKSATMSKHLGQRFEHGWPMTHLSRFTQNVDDRKREATNAILESLGKSSLRFAKRPSLILKPEKFWTNPENWSQIGQTNSASTPCTKIHWRPLGINLIVLTALLIGIGIPIEYRRRRKSFLQFDLKELALATLLVSATFALYSSVAAKTRQQAESQKELKTLFANRITFRARDQSPVWLSRFLDNNSFLTVSFGADKKRKIPFCMRATELSFNNMGPNFLLTNDPERAGELLGQLKQVKVANNWPTGKQGLELLDHFPTGGIEELNFAVTGKRDFFCVAKFQRVQKVSFRLVRIDSSNFDYPVLPELETLELDPHQFLNSDTLEWLTRLPKLKRLVVLKTSIFKDEWRTAIQARLPDLNIERR
jgi:hypothetical protein